MENSLSHSFMSRSPLKSSSTLVKMSAAKARLRPCSTAAARACPGDLVLLLLLLHRQRLAQQLVASCSFCASSRRVRRLYCRAWLHAPSSPELPCVLRQVLLRLLPLGVVRVLEVPLLVQGRVDGRVHLLHRLGQSVPVQRPLLLHCIFGNVVVARHQPQPPRRSILSCFFSYSFWGCRRGWPRHHLQRAHVVDHRPQALDVVLDPVERDCVAHSSFLRLSRSFGTSRVLVVVLLRSEAHLCAAHALQRRQLDIRRGRGCARAPPLSSCCCTRAPGFVQGYPQKNGPPRPRDPAHAAGQALLRERRGNHCRRTLFLRLSAAIIQCLLCVHAEVIHLPDRRNSDLAGFTVSGPDCGGRFHS